MPVLIDFLKEVETDRGDLFRQLQKCKSLARKVKACRVPDSATTVSIGKQMPTRQLADQLIEAYLRIFETVYRTIHVPTFRAEYERYWADPQAADDSFVILLQLCMAIGAAFQDDTLAVNSELSTSLQEMMRQLCKFHETGGITSFQLRYSEVTMYRFFLTLHQPILPKHCRIPSIIFLARYPPT
ncbi:hypothetical protein NW754_003798 [Fusarium falciforme]|uniref:Xylanolytic transcriptional activator regulatory domain-containing protein n=1 Tax=Fusarium falciforme TaxID=195108 RepID=A0A9W8QV92_9HYPO|nr:hypothetical protein NW754_003798 [Fusarium falciforme]KAJ4177348.1 hypothetical protein NW755_013899 [Fusarium falciforme]KAJ4181545.1 hypothetical protein NW767_014132 [Fusarium falciforme]KAJ4239579.1 hypothetical protein NW757_012600 [Fusarium falciforme]